MKRKTPLLYGPLIGAHIRDLRLERGMSLHGMHKLGGPTPSQISCIERGKSDFNIETLVQIAKTLGVLPAELLPNELFDAVKWGVEVRAEPTPERPKPWHWKNKRNTQ
jgi:transcriptional regulator with XRE-family HTH domain